MPLRILAVSALLVVLVACRDGPTELVTPVENRTEVQPEATAAVDALTTVVQLLDDPFVRELMYGVGADVTSLNRAVRDVSISGTQDHVVTLSHTLAATRSELLAGADDEEEDGEEEILRSVLELVLDDAATLLERPSSGVEREQRGRGVEIH
jgi:hypothetical protein